MKFTLKEWNKIWEMLERDKSKMSVRVAEYDRKIKEYHGEEDDEDFQELLRWRKKYADELAFVKSMLEKLDNEDL